MFNEKLMNEKISGWLGKHGGSFQITNEEGHTAAVDFEAMGMNLYGAEAILRSSGQEYDPLVVLSPWYKVTRIIVHPSMRRKQYARRLMHVLSTTADTKGFNLYCEADPYAGTIPMRPLKRFFESNGFKKVPKSSRVMLRLAKSAPRG